jgi:hypothetical protein
MAALPLLAIGPIVSQAASPSQTECEDRGGTFSREQGTVICTDPVGNSQSENAQTVDTNGKGNLTNEKKTACEGPGNGDSTAQCP